MVLPISVMNCCILAANMAMSKSFLAEIVMYILFNLNISFCWYIFFYVAIGTWKMWFFFFVPHSENEYIAAFWSYVSLQHVRWHESGYEVTYDNNLYQKNMH